MVPRIFGHFKASKMKEKKTSEGSRSPNRSSKKHDQADENQVLPYKKRGLFLGSNDNQKVSQPETSCGANYINQKKSYSDTDFGVVKNKSDIKKISSSSTTTFDKAEVSANASLQKLRDPRDKLPLAMLTRNKGDCVKKRDGDKISVKGPKSVRIQFGNHSGSLRSDLPRGDASDDETNRDRESAGREEETNEGKKTVDDHNKGEVSQDRGGTTGDAVVGRKGKNKDKDGSNEVITGIHSNTPPPEQQASHTFRLFGVDIDRESTIISRVRISTGHGYCGDQSSIKKCKVGLRLMGYDI